MTLTLPKQRTERSLLLVLLSFSLLMVLYLVLRFAADWTGHDTVAMANIISNVYSQGTLVPAGEAYTLGMNPQAVSVMLIHLTGVPLEGLVQRALPLLLMVDVLVAYVAYRTLTQDRWAGLFAASLLAMQPEFLFTTTRGSHEKITWLLTLLGLFVLARSFMDAGRFARFVVWTAIFYLVAFALITTNAFFASSLLAALALCFLAATALSYLILRKGTEFSRLIYVTASCSILVYLFMFHLYAPAVEAFNDLRPTIDRIAALLFGVEVPFSTAAATGHVASGWATGSVYLALSAATYVLTLISFVYWLVLAWRLWKGRLRGSPLFLLWLLYAAFAFQMALSVGAAGLGLLASNLQVRLFPVFMLLVMPLAALGLQEGARCIRARRQHAVLAVLALLFAGTAGAAAFKATNEPLLSNTWTFRVRNEQLSVEWVDEYTRYGDVWLGTDRLRYTAGGYEDPLRHRYDIYGVDEFTRYALVSRFEETRMLRMGIPQPALGQENQVYDNGTARAYHFRPRTPYQR